MSSSKKQLLVHYRPLVAADVRRARLTKRLLKVISTCHLQQFFNTVKLHDIISFKDAYNVLYLFHNFKLFSAL